MNVINQNLKPEDELNLALSLASETVNKGYLPKLSQTSTKVVDFINIYHEKNDRSIDNSVKLLKLTKFCYEKGEDILQKLSTVYNSVMSENMNLVILIDSKLNKPVDFYIGVASVTVANFGKNIKVLNASIDGNFTGSKFEGLDDSQINVENIFKDVFNNATTISSVSTNSSLRDKTNTQEKDFVQGIEKFIDTMQGKSYTAFFIAQPIFNNELASIKYGFESLYTDLSQFAKTTSSYSINDSIAINKSISKGINESTSYARGSSKSVANTEAESIGQGGNFGAGLLNFNAGFNINENNSTSLGVVNGVNENIGKSNAKVHMDTNGSTTSQSYGSTIQFESINKSINNILKQIDNQLDKIEKGSSYGLFKYAAYFISSSENNITLAANTYKALMQGDGEQSEEIAVNLWRKSNTKNFNMLKNYLSRCMHPVFELQNTVGYFDATTFINGLQLPIHMGLPIKSVVGLPVIEHTRFGRSVNNTQNSIPLGSIYHMGKKETQRVNIDIKSLASHTFVSGTTGSGKSNTIYKILEELNNNNINFLIIEPTKGEYKNMFGNRSDVNVYGTNPKLTKMLRINPFRFNENIHVLEHIDRLVDIFNVCWSMYDAMPAVLKDAIERSYIECGWNMITSVNSVDSMLYPTFNDVLEQINVVIFESMYSDEIKGNYIGALSTRIKSLTNGINGIIFNCDYICDEVLFDENTIIDLSRLGSSETKSLIMGILVMKLSEHHLAFGVENSALKHVTVLEEAHNILKRTSTEQSNTGANLVGKSVEMLSNAIAEMRTYGEGFIIADQSPSMLDMSVIRNTNTKIIMKLPDFSDRDLVGKSSNLNNEQIIELSRLETGVASVFQNNWVEPVLCLVDEVKRPNGKFIQPDTLSLEPYDFSNYILDLIKSDKSLENMIDIKDKIIKSDLKSSQKVNLLDVNDKEKIVFKRKFIYDTFQASTIINKLDKNNPDEWINKFIQTPEINILSKDIQEMIIRNILEEKVSNDINYNIVLNKFEEEVKSGGFM